MRGAIAALTASVALIVSCHGEEDEDEGFDADADSATLRREAMYEWYNDHKPTHPSQYWSRDYMKYVLGVAADEHARWPALLPRLGVSQLVTGNQWVNIGPTKADVATNTGTSIAKTDSGRVRTIIPAGARLYVATAGGGVWRSDNNGASWTAITEVLGTLSIGSLALDPANANTLYLGLGDPYDGTGIGFVKSTDGGDTWSPPVYLGDSSIIPQVFAQAGFVFAATNKGLYRSTDSGATFAKVSLATGSMEAPYVWSIASTGAHSLAIALEASPSVTTATTDGQVWISTNDGATWTRATGMTKMGGVGRITLASAPSNRSIVYAMAAVPNSTAATDLADMFKSTDGGATWTALNVTNKRYTNSNQDNTRVGALLNGQGWYNGTIAVNPTNPNDVWFGGALLATNTKDGGATFTAKSQWLGQNGLPYVHADFHAATFSADGSKLYLGSDGGVFVSSDGGTTFSDSLNIGLTTHMFYSVGSSPAAPSAVIGGLQDNGTRVRAGTTSTFNQYLGGDGFGSHINQTNPTQMLGTLYYARIYKSTDSGVTFNLASTGITESNNSTTAPFITRINPRAETNELYTFSNAKVYKSTNYATSWSVVGATVTTTGSIRNVGVAWDNASYIGVVGSGGRVWLTSNGGTTWNQVAAGKQGEDPTALPDGQLSLSDIRFDPADATHQTIFVASVAPEAGAGHLWKTTNGGTTWTRIDANGLPPGIPINLTKSDPQNPAIIFAATHLGVYRSADGGATWARFGGGMPFTNVMDLYISPDGSLVRAATFGRGIWELTTVANNRAPVLAAVGSKTVNHGATLAFTLSATDQDNDTVSYAATTLPAGAILSPTGGFTYTPVCGDIGTKTITFTAQDGKGGTDSETITITVNGGKVGLAPTTLDFGMVFTNGSTSKNVTASSTGTMPITFASATANDPAFTVPTPPSGPITTNTTIGVAFKPTAAQDYAATLTVTATDGTACTPTTTIPLTGHASATSLGVAPTTPDFGDVRTDRTAYPTQAFTVTNMGAADIAVSDIVLDDTTNFGLDKGDFASATTLAPNATATFTVTARPQSIGAHAATVTVMSNTTGDNAHPIAISENGVRPLLELSTSSLDFGTTAGTQNLTLTNTGTADVTLDGAVVTGSGATAYAVSPPLPTTLAAGAMFELMVAYTPDGNDTATLTITSDANATDACGSAGCATATIALSGTGPNKDDGGGDEGGCCDSSGGGTGQSLLLGVVVLGLIRRRR